ncbi:MAG TPA: M56 family metallopeptidase [Polyangiaceae bacterium]|nr:M56 family metallopeptidase [Polyangiaceae bacterium]
MMLAGDALFNLMLNAVCSFWLALAATLAIRRVASPLHASVGIGLFLLPLAKLFWDLRVGIPAGSFFWASEQGVKQRLGSFQIGFGVHPWGAAIDGYLWAQHDGGRSPQSIADLLCRALRFRVSVYAASVVSYAVLAVSVVRASLCGFRLTRFSARVRALLATHAMIERRSLGRRSVRVYTSADMGGVPFAGGLFRPYVVLPATLNDRLTAEEREAVIQHELGHIRHFDLALLVPLEISCEFLWFVPGLQWLLRKLRSLLEERADDCAVAAGVARESLATALLTTAELTAHDGCVPVLAIAREPSTLRLRVQRLLAPPAVRVVKPGLAFARGLLLLWLVLGTLQASACGNHP